MTLLGNNGIILNVFYHSLIEFAHLVLIRIPVFLLNSFGPVVKTAGIFLLLAGICRRKCGAGGGPSRAADPRGNAVRAPFGTLRKTPAHKILRDPKNHDTIEALFQDDRHSE